MGLGEGAARRSSEAGLYGVMPIVHEKPARPSIAIPGSQAVNMVPEQTSPSTAWNAYTSSQPPPLLEAVSPTDHRYLFNAYIYDYLYKQGYQDAARAFLFNAPDTPVKRAQANQDMKDGNSSKSAGGTQLGRRPGGAQVDTTDLHVGNAESSNAHLREAAQAAQQLHSAFMPVDEEEGNDSMNGAGGDTSFRTASRHQRSRTGPAPGTADSDKSDHSQSSATSSRFDGTSKDSNTTNATSLASRDASRRFAEADTSSELPNSITTPPSQFGATGGSSNTRTPRMPTSGSNASAGQSLPEPDVQITAPKGFLFEWWSVFWDIFRARGEKGGSPAAKAYYQVAHEAVRPPSTFGRLRLTRFCRRCCRHGTDSPYVRSPMDYQQDSKTPARLLLSICMLSTSNICSYNPSKVQYRALCHRSAQRRWPVLLVLFQSRKSRQSSSSRIAVELVLLYRASRVR